MDMKLLCIFVGLNIVNVILQTVKSIATVKCGKGAAALINAIAFGLYTIVTVYTMCDLPLYLKAGIVAMCNLIGVYVVKFFEEKARRDKVWKVEATVPSWMAADIHRILNEGVIAHNYITGVGKYTIFNIYCPTQVESNQVRVIMEAGNIKYFVSESKTL